jgi:hypothetical protein
MQEIDTECVLGFDFLHIIFFLFKKVPVNVIRLTLFCVMFTARSRRSPGQDGGNGERTAYTSQRSGKLARWIFG